MKIAILSDVHNQTRAMIQALKAAKQAQCEALIFLGDFESPQCLELMVQEWQKPLHFVLGNNDYPRHKFEAIAQQHAHVHCYGDSACIQLAGKEIYFSHYPHLAQLALQHQEIELILYGHTHEAHMQKTGAQLLLNPGELQGRQSTRSWALYDSLTHSASHHELP